MRHVDTISCKLSSDNAQQLNVHPEVVDVETVLHNREFSFLATAFGQRTSGVFEEEGDWHNQEPGEQEGQRFNQIDDQTPVSHGTTGVPI